MKALLTIAAIWGLALPPNVVLIVADELRKVACLGA